MSKFDLRYGDGTVQIDLSDAKSLNVLNGKKRPPLDDLAAAFKKAVDSESIDAPALKAELCSDDKITIIVSDITRFWMRQDLICPLLVDYLHADVGIAYENIVIVIALVYRFANN